MKNIISLVLTALLMTFSSCSLFNQNTTGSLRLNLNDEISSRTLEPALDMSIASYQLSGTGPEIASFTETSSSAALTIGELAFGDWTISVKGLNDDGTIIGSGEGTTTVHTGETSTVDITITPLSGTGSLDLTLDWTAGDTEVPSVTGVLTPASGSDVDLGFTLSGGNNAVSLTNGLDAGYYTLSLKLMDNGLLTMGAVEIVRIVKDETTYGSFLFDDINKPGGSIQVNISQQMANPLDISINGAATSKEEEETLNLSASVNDYADNVTWVWYVNGASTATGESFAFDNSYEAGIYRIDLTGFSADGTRAGSESTEITVNKPVGYGITMKTILSGTQTPAICSLQGETENVILTRAYAVSETEITHAQFIEFMNDRGVNPDGTYNGVQLVDMTGPIDHVATGFQFGAGGTSYAPSDATPVVLVSWYGAVEFCNWLSEEEGKNPVYNTSDWSWEPEKNGYRLPTESEWEYAAQGGNGTTYDYAGSDTLSDVGWFSDNSGSMNHPVKGKAPNAYGLYDMSGNAWEWCHDWSDTFAGGTDPEGPATSSSRIRRGGSHADDSSWSLNTARHVHDPGVPIYDVGFRLARTL